MKRYKFIDLFAGAGGLSEGFIRAGFEPIAHIEMDHYACDSLRTRAAYHYLKAQGKLSIYEEYLKTKKEKTNGQWLWDRVPETVIDSVIQEAIGKDTIEGIFQKVDKLCNGEKVDIIIGGPPCQAYSVAGRARLGKKIEEDPRNDLYKFYVQFIERYQPEMFVFENVLGIRTAKNGEPFRDLQELVRNLGYEIRPEEQIASEHGVLQNRHRIIIVGWKVNRCGTNIPTTYEYPILPKESLPYCIKKDLFDDLPERKAGEGELCGIVEYTKPLKEMQYLKLSGIRGALGFTTQHIARPTNENDREIYRQAVELWKSGKRLNYAKLAPNLQKHKNKETFLNRFCVVDPNGYCHTVVAHIAMDGHYYIYPNESPTLDNVRSITIREAARIQSFPDDFFFEGSRSAAFKQIGNAVPVVLAEKIGKKIKQLLEHEDELR
jgi:DNA (cytosine-5)-methyltransferase 1